MNFVLNMRKSSPTLLLRLRRPVWMNRNGSEHHVSWVSWHFDVMPSSGLLTDKASVPQPCTCFILHFCIFFPSWNSSRSSNSFSLHRRSRLQFDDPSPPPPLTEANQFLWKGLSVVVVAVAVLVVWMKMIWKLTEAYLISQRRTWSSTSTAICESKL